jgi:hypothetical protein
MGRRDYAMFLLIATYGLRSTCVYLRLNVENLRDVALDLPREVRQ